MKDVITIGKPKTFAELAKEYNELPRYNAMKDGNCITRWDSIIDTFIEKHYKVAELYIKGIKQCDYIFEQLNMRFVALDLVDVVRVSQVAGIVYLERIGE